MYTQAAITPFNIFYFSYRDTLSHWSKIKLRLNHFYAAIDTH